MKNRIVKSCAGSEMQKSFDWPSDTSLGYYEQFAKGGVGMICFETSTVIPKAKGTGSNAAVPTGIVMYSLDISTDDGIPAHKAIADDIHKYGTPIIAQMYDMMMANGASSSLMDNQPLEPSFANGHMQTTKEVQYEQKCFIDAAERYYKAGFDGVEINCSCNHYFSTYLSRSANYERTDQYSGASIENRARIVTEIIEGIRKRCGKDFIVQVLFSGVEENVRTLGENEKCTTMDEACELAKLFEKAGASSLHIRSEAYGHHCGGFMPDVMHIPEDGYTGYASVMDYSQHFNGSVLGQYDGVAALLNVAAKIKSAVSIPVGAVGSMDPRLAPDLLNNAIIDGKLDFMLMTRPLMADPEIANKLKAGKRDEVAPCTHCMTCFVAPFDFGQPMYCRVNPAITRAFSEDMPEGYDPTPAKTPRKVMVIGGGPSGMEAARIAAQRGHKVTLYEKDKDLGGTMNLTAWIKGPHEKIADHKAYLIRQMELNNVTVVKGKTVDLNLVKSEAPDSVIVAVGGLCDKPDVTGINNKKVLTIDDFRPYAGGDKELPTGASVAIIGAQFEACDLAIHLLKRGKKVSILNPGPESEYYMNAPTWPRTHGRSWIRARGGKLYHEVILKSITDDGVTFDTNYGTTETVVCDTVIVATPFQTNRALFDSIKKICEDVYAVGDCYSPNTIANAIARANIVARKIGSVKAQGETTAAGTGTAYTSTATGIGDVTVTITVDNGAITSAVVDTSNETAGVGRDLGTDFAKQILTNGSVDAVSGASVTSAAVKKALENCLAQAGLK